MITYLKQRPISIYIGSEIVCIEEVDWEEIY